MDVLRHNTGPRRAPTLRLLSCLLVAPLLAAGEASEREVKAAMLFSFTKFVEWPADSFHQASAPLGICLLGRDPFGPLLDRLVADRSVAGHPIHVKRFHHTADTKGCHVLYIGSSESKHVEEALEAMPGAAVLTVSDTEHFTRRGGVVGFVMEDNKVRFEVNLNAAGRARLRISARLLKLARDVQNGAPAGGGKD